MKILFHSLGCDKNLADSEEMIGLLVKAGYEMSYLCNLWHYDEARKAKEEADQTSAVVS